MKLNKAGIDLIKAFEGCSLKAYPDPATGGEPITIGFGFTGGIKLGDKWTQKQADDALNTVLNHLQAKISRLVRHPVNENQFSALICLAYNIGTGNLGSSTLLKLVNAKDYKAAAKEFPKWNKANKKVMPGLTRRRLAEQKLFETPVVS